MLKELKFVSGSVGKSKNDASLAHFIIKDGRVKSFNGTIAMSCPLPTALDVQPDANQLIKAVGNCKDAVELTVTAAGKLRVKSGAFKAFVNCYNEVIPSPDPEGLPVEIDGKVLLDALKLLSPFMGTDGDSAHAWTNGIFFKGKSAYATNNVCLVEAWVGSVFPLTANVPSVAVKELLRIGEAPTLIQQSPRSVTFHYPNGRWLRTQLRQQEFPASMIDMFKARELALMSVPGEMWGAVEALSPFVDDLHRIFFKDGQAFTHADSETGASFAVPHLPTCVFNINMLKLLRPVATKIDFKAYPKSGYFQGVKDGVKVRGLIAPMRGL